MKQALLIAFVIFLVGFAVFIYPSFITRPGIDCLAGCATGIGFPLSYLIIHSGGIADFPPTREINFPNLFVNLLVLLFISLMPLIIGKFIKKN